MSWPLKNQGLEDICIMKIDSFNIIFQLQALTSRFAYGIETLLSHFIDKKSFIITGRLLMKFRLLILTFALLLPCFFSPLQAQEVEEETEGDIGGFRFSGRKEFSIGNFLQLVANVENMKFILGTNAQAEGKNVTIIAPAGQSEEDGFFVPYTALFSMLQVMLKTQDLILAPFGEDKENEVRFYEVLPLNEAITSSREQDVQVLDDIKDFEATDGAGFVTLIAPLKYADFNTVRAALANFTTRRGGVVSPVAGVNALLIADYAFNVKRMGKIVRLIDKPPLSPRLEVIDVNYMDAGELADALDQLIVSRNAVSNQVQGPGTNQSQNPETAVDISVAPNRNALLVQGYDQGIQIVQKLIDELDIKIPGFDGYAAGRLHVYTPRNVLAEDLATTLESLINEGVGLAADPNLPAPPGGVVIENEDDRPFVIEDVNSNKLLINARPSDYNELIKIIEALDVPKSQVMIEAAILEVRDDEDFTFGSELLTVDGAGENLRVNAGTFFGFSDIVDASGVPLGTGGGSPAGRSPLFGQGGIFTLTKGGPFDIPLLIRFIKQQTDINILSAPRILTNNSTDSSGSGARIDIKTDVPIRSTTTNNTVTSSDFRYEEDGIELEVEPTIRQNSVELDISLDVSAFIGQPPEPGAPPPRTGRIINTTITIPDGSTIAIGGLMSSSTSKTVNKIPFFGDIPGLGEFFKSEVLQSRRTNLYIFVRPKIYNSRDFEDLREDSSTELTEAQKRLLPSEATREFFEEALEDNKRQRTTLVPGLIPRKLAIRELPEED